MGCIYCITNLINSKRYVGKTTDTIEEKFQEHCRDSKKERCEKRPLYSAFNKYGIENFKIEELEFVEDDNLLSDKEMYWINELGSYGKNDYNATRGDDGTVLYDHIEIIELYNLGYICKQTTVKIGCHEDTVRKVLKAHNVKINNMGIVTNKPYQFEKIGGYLRNKNFIGNFTWQDKYGCSIKGEVTVKNKNGKEYILKPDRTKVLASLRRNKNVPNKQIVKSKSNVVQSITPWTERETVINSNIGESNKSYYPFKTEQDAINATNEANKLQSERKANVNKNVNNQVRKTVVRRSNYNDNFAKLGLTNDERQVIKMLDLIQIMQKMYRNLFYLRIQMLILDLVID